MLGKGSGSGPARVVEHRTAIFGLAGGLFLFLFILLSTLPVKDYGVLVEAARAWQSDPLTLYTSDTHGFYLLPWTLFVTVPLSFLPDQLAQAVLNLGSLLAVSATAWLLVRPNSPWQIVPAIANPYMASVLLLGQWDAITLGGIGLGWWAIQRKRALVLGLGLAIASTKPTNLWLPCLVLLLESTSWSFREISRVSLLPLLAISSSFVLVGRDWPERYLAFVSETPPFGFDISLFGTERIGLQIAIAAVVGTIFLRSLRKGVLEIHLNLALVANTLVTPYLVPYHLVTLGPAITGIIKRNPVWGVLIWIFSGFFFFAFIIRWHPHLVLLFPAVTFMSLAWSLEVAKHERPGTSESGDSDN